MVITEHVIAEFRVFKLIIRQIQAKINARRLKLAEFGSFKLISKRISANLGKRRLMLTEFVRNRKAISLKHLISASLSPLGSFRKIFTVASSLESIDF